MCPGHRQGDTDAGLTVELPRGMCQWQNSQTESYSPGQETCERRGLWLEANLAEGKMKDDEAVQGYKTDGEGRHFTRREG